MYLSFSFFICWPSLLFIIFHTKLCFFSALFYVRLFSGAPFYFHFCTLVAVVSWSCLKYMYAPLIYFPHSEDDSGLSQSVYWFVSLRICLLDLWSMWNKRLINIGMLHLYKNYVDSFCYYRYSKVYPKAAFSNFNIWALLLCLRYVLCFLSFFSFIAFSLLFLSFISFCFSF